MSLSEEEVLTPLAPPQGRKPRRWVWAGLVGVATVGALAAVALSRAQKERYSVHRFANAVRAFSVRALQDEPDFVSSAEITFNEVDAEAPSKTGVKFSMQQSEEEYEGSAPVLKVIFHAKEGKGEDLVAKIKQARDALCKAVGGQQGDDAEGDCEAKILVEQVEAADEVAITVVAPESAIDEQVKKDLEHQPTFEFEVFFGHSLKEMFDNRNDLAFPLLPGGMRASLNVAIPSALASDIAKDMSADERGPQDMLASFFSGFSRQNLKYEVLYKSAEDLGSLWQNLPTSQMAFDMLIKSFQAEAPPTVQAALKGLDEVADGLKSVSFGNLPGKYEFRGDFTNFKVSEVIKAVLDVEPPKGFFSSRTE